MYTVLPCLRQLQHHLLHLHLSLAVVQAQLLLLYQALGRPQSLPNFVHFPWFQKQSVDLFLSLLVCCECRACNNDCPYTRALALVHVPPTINATTATLQRSIEAS